jgi:tyrosyl-tRNA synthetase
MTNELMTIFKRGLEQIVPEDALQNIQNAKKPLLVKFGADPSAPDLHLGHCVVLKKLRVLQDMGHRVQFVIGDFTARIGDPTGKSETRKPLTEEDVKVNATSYQEQVFKILDKAKTDVVYNSTWLGVLSSTELISLSARYTVARMLERDDFSKRFKSNQPISVHEFLYPLLQGYDSVVLKSDVEMGGTDQTFNLLMGRHLQRDYAVGKEQVMITVPILEGLDGVQKMSKSLNNHIGIMDSPKEMFGKTMSIPDDKITRYFSLLTDVSDVDIAEMTQKMSSDGVNPRDFKIDLAKCLIRTFYSAQDADAAEEEFKRVFAKGLVPDDMPEVRVADSSVLLLGLLVDQHMVPSKKEGQRLIQAGAVSVDGEKISDFRYEMSVSGERVVKVGKRKFLKVVKA